MKRNNPFHKIPTGDYRIIYEVQEEILVILIVKIAIARIFIETYRNIRIQFYCYNVLVWGEELYRASPQAA